MNLQEAREEAERLNAMLTELLELDCHRFSADDHIITAQGLLTTYSNTLSIQLDHEPNIVAEGTLEFVRHVAEMHLKIAEAINSGLK